MSRIPVSLSEMLIWLLIQTYQHLKLQASQSTTSVKLVWGHDSELAQQQYFFFFTCYATVTSMYFNALTFSKSNL